MDLFELFNLKGKTAIVTGGGKGLGAQMAAALAEAGSNVVLCSRDLKACQSMAESLESRGVKTLAVQCDVTKKQDIQHVIDETLKEFGQIDILVNNSGTSWIAPALELPEDKWDKVMNVNMKAVFLFSQAAAKAMMAQGSGKIVNIASVTGFGGTQPELLDTIAYNTSKGAVMTFTKDLAAKLARHNIQVNAIAPGFFPTKISKKILESNTAILKQIPARRFGDDDDLKGAVVFLASRASDYVSGHVLVVDGGISSLV
ncbi:glucose 1-dehydrogenase [Heyndrickxia acidicola]|jgi:gluconate 5-dehydrogenase|uniref:Glucose 1-dehydrogenase n=1 Tax=Heyndrickxia acidicola TaxID=209389 RepID=A0ABU6MJ22_9BACI|nr:glucose 1-dehydrogenase [Heyndrickxia acidicola]MED1204459.1 glucose 1-dehydrogenase [Heyndrickxia acidicola]